MAWLVLVVSGALEAVWAVALGRSEGFTRPAPTAVFLVAMCASMAGLAMLRNRWNGCSSTGLK